jgi:hypothetical protein
VLTRNTFAAILASMADSGSQRRPDRRFEPPKPLEWQIVEFAVAQHGVVALWQLVELGPKAQPSQPHGRRRAGAALAAARPQPSPRRGGHS